jgi:hypothetical protein
MTTAEIEAILDAERRLIWVYFNTPAAQKAAEEMLMRISSAISRAETGS